jgi:DNA-binding beta-propeller fold protein YncE
MALLVIALVILFFVPLPIDSLRSLQVLSPKENYQAVLQWGQEGEATGNLRHPMGLAWEEGFLYVADAENGAIEKFQEDGAFVAQWKGFKRPVAVAAVGDFVYVADFLADQISKLHNDGTLIAQWGRRGKGEGEFDAPSGIAADRHGQVYVADFYNHRIQKFTTDGKFLLQWGGNSRRSGKFHYPTDVAVNNQDKVFVADAFNHRIQKFTRDGHYLTKWGGTGYGLSGKWSGWFRLAKAVAVDQEGHVYVADAFNHRVQKFTGQGKLITWWGGQGSSLGQIHYVAGVVVNAQGAVFVSDFFNNRIEKFVPIVPEQSKKHNTP